MAQSAPEDNNNTNTSNGVAGSGGKSSEFLSITPSPTLHFMHRRATRKGTKSPKCTITLRHPDPTGDGIAFKIKTSNRPRYLVQPNKGLVAPGTSQTVNILLHDNERTFSPTLNTPRDGFIVETCPFSPSHPDSSVDNDTWTRATRDGTLHQTALHAVHDILPHELEFIPRDDMMSELFTLRLQNAELRSTNETLARENERLKKDMHRRCKKVTITEGDGKTNTDDQNHLSSPSINQSSYQPAQDLDDAAVKKTKRGFPFFICGKE